ncbi:alpha/beta fold hydrolase [Paenibacillus cymbidii]|uniref:alpha/beta fold hydrolase n=1 Tax=Paenibacillus cymbidii TaxID=1639034 RepID=UPI00108099E2|nr:alpha/beta fold hydrolase [Paenibacillus cymbidii]
MKNGMMPYTIPPSEAFDNWLAETGETAPDMASLRAFPDLPPLLSFYDGTPVASADDWERRKAEIKQLLCHYFLGTFPETVPALIELETLAEGEERGAVRRELRLTFDTVNRASFRIELWIPEGEGPFPVFLTQANHRRWALSLLSRGYIVCVYPGADADDQTAAFAEAYPACDWRLIARRAWLASRALDYVLTLPEADGDKVAIAGHSRNGKQSLIAAAFDERIRAVVSGSSGSAGICPYRFVSESTFQESLEFTTRVCPTWFHPRLRWFTGREHYLPIDIHGLLGLIAPRSCLLSVALNDGCESPYAVERSYAAGKEVYAYLGEPDALRMLWRTGGHEISGEDVQKYADWFDRAFARGAADFPERWLYRFDWSRWRSSPAGQASLPASAGGDDASAGKDDRERRRERVRWGLGQAPPGGFERGGRFHGSAFCSEPAHKHLLLRHDEGCPDSVARLSVNFGDSIGGNLYFRRDRTAPAPVVIWLHPYSHATGYFGAYLDQPRVFHFLAEQGCVVLAFDQIGFGGRWEEGERFYERYPNWSRLGKMVRDVQEAVDFLTAEPTFGSMQRQFGVEVPAIDPQRIYCLGYSLGGAIGLHAAALDERIAGVASFSGFTPMRTDTDVKPTGGIRRLWEWHSLQPRLGLYHGRESELPYDYDDLLTLVAPRPCLLVSPLHDREADTADVTACVERVRPAWEQAGANPSLTHVVPNDYNRFTLEQQQQFLHWLRGVDAAAGADKPGK